MDDFDALFADADKQISGLQAETEKNTKEILLKKAKEMLE